MSYITRNSQPVTRIMQRKRLFIITFIVAFVLLMPLIAMQFTDEVNWTLGDFAVAGLLLFGVGLLFDLVIRTVNKSEYRTVIYVAIVVMFLLIWAELAVGILWDTICGKLGLILNETALFIFKNASPTLSICVYHFLYRAAILQFKSQ